MRAVDPTLNPPPNDGTRDFVVGGFQSASYNTSLSAHSDPMGQDVHGFETNTTRGGDEKYRQRVTCLAVAETPDGNVAAYGLVVTHSASNVVPPGTEYVEVVRDSGLPGGQFDGWLSFDSPAENCPAFLEIAPFAATIVRGNILVHNAQP
jgi:hypothetical protein